MLLLCLNRNHSVYAARHYICISLSLSQTQSFCCLDSTAVTTNKECKSLTIKGVYTSVEENPAQRLNAELDDKNNSSDE